MLHTVCSVCKPTAAYQLPDQRAKPAPAAAEYWKPAKSSSFLVVVRPYTFPTLCTQREHMPLLTPHGMQLQW